MVALLLISVLVGVFLERALYYRGLAEKSAMEQVALDLRSSVNLRVAELILENRFADLIPLAAQNPMDLLERKPQNYLGILNGAGVQEIVPGNWYFDNTSKEVVYYVDSGRYFAPDEQGRMRAAWRVKLVQGGGRRRGAAVGPPGTGAAVSLVLNGRQAPGSLSRCVHRGSAAGSANSAGDSP